MKRYYIKDGKHYRFYIGLHKRFQGFGFMWEEDISDVLRSHRHYHIELRLFWFKTWFNYNRLAWKKINLTETYPSQDQ